jgi:hypothetical protein
MKSSQGNRLVRREFQSSVLENASASIIWHDDNVFFGQGYNTAAWNNDGMVISRGKQKNSEKDMHQCHFIPHKSHVKSPGLEQSCPW